MFELGGNTLSFAVHGGGESGGMAGWVSKLLASLEKWVSLSPDRLFAELMPGIAGLENLHPLFVHFPIALLSSFFIIDTVAMIANQAAWRKLASSFLYLGAFFSILTVAAGLIAADSVPHGDEVHDIMEHHEHLGISVLLLSMVLSLWRFMAHAVFEGTAKVLHSLSSVIMMLLLALTADLGGFMVYGHGVAVRPMMERQQAAAERHRHDDGDTAHHDEHDVAAPQTLPQSASPAATPVHVEPAIVHIHADGSKHSHAH